jgi:Fe-S-cluster-containing hydrogenase component 2
MQPLGRRIVIHEDLCSGCRACEVACVAAKEKVFGTALARIRVTKVEPLGIDLPHVCRQCRHAPCISVCPSGALYRDEATNAILVHSAVVAARAVVGRDPCIGCSACVDACPFGMAALHPESGLALICDLCGGDPACVKRCATGAITFVSPESGPRSKRQKLALDVAGKADKGWR